MIEIKQALETKDHLLTNELAKTIWPECYSDTLSIEQIQYMLNKFFSLEAIKENINDSYEYYHIYYDNKLAGFFAYQNINSQEIYLSKLYILNSFRNKHIASNIIQKLKEKNITLNVNKYNQRAINAYLSWGFKIIKSEVNDIGCNYVMDDYVMKYTK